MENSHPHLNETIWERFFPVNMKTRRKTRTGSAILQAGGKQF
jgi:hypothetical protein